MGAWNLPPAMHRLSYMTGKQVQGPALGAPAASRPCTRRRAGLLLPSETRPARSLPRSLPPPPSLPAGVAILSAVLTLRYGTGWPLLARWALAYTAAVGATVAVLASTRRSAFVCRRFFCKDPVTGRIPW